MSYQLTEGKYFGDLLNVRKDTYVHYSLTSYLPEEGIGKHTHENSYISILVKGAYAEVNKEGNMFLQPGNIIYRPAGCSHSNQFNLLGGICFNIELKKNWQEQFSDFTICADCSNIS